MRFGNCAVREWRFATPAPYRAGRVGARATPVCGRYPLSPRRTGGAHFPSGSPESSRLRHSQVPVDGSNATAPRAGAPPRLLERSIHARCLQPPRKVGCLLAPLASPSVWSGFILVGGLAPSFSSRLNRVRSEE